MYLLSLDLSSHVGWSRGRPDDRHFEYGTHVLPKTGEDVGDFLYAYREWLGEALDSVSLCCMEAPILPKVTSLATCRKLYGLAGVTELMCRDKAIKCREVNLMSVKAFIGVAGMGKDAMVRAIRRYGFDPQDDNQADAIAVRLFVLHALYPGVHGMRMELGLLGGRVNG